MSKVGKVKSRRSADKKPSRNVPLAQQIEDESSVRPSGREKKRNRNDDDDKVFFLIIVHCNKHAGQSRGF